MSEIIANGTSKKAFAYIRVSTSGQAEEGLGLEIQREHILNYAKEHNLEIVKIYSDEGVSGTIKDRPGIIALLQAIDDNGVRDVVTHSQSRLSRDLGVSLWLEVQFEKRNVKLHYSSEPNFDSPNDPMGTALKHIKAVFCQLEKDTITLRLLSGRRQKASHGEFSGGRPAFGYKAQNGALTIDPAQAKIVKKIFSLRKKGLTMQAIADKLNSQGLKGRGKKFYASTVQYLLDNREKTYSGIVKYGSVKAQGVHQPIR